MFIIVGLSAIFVTAAVLIWRSDAALDDRGQSATAQVISVHRNTRGMSIATVQFSTADGRIITTQTRPDELIVPPPAVGSTIPVIYDPENPQAKVRDPRAPQDNALPPVVVAGAGIAFLGVVVVRTWQRRNRRSAGDDEEQ